MNTFRKIYKVLDRIRFVIICAAFSFILLLCAYQVVARYLSFLHLRLFPWGDEIIRMTSVWISFMAASLGVQNGAHLSVDILKDKLPAKPKRIVEFVSSLIVLTVMAALVYFGSKYAISNTISKLLNVNMAKAWFYSALPVGAAYMFLEYLIILIWGTNPFVEISRSSGSSDTASDAESSDNEGSN